MFKGVIGIWGRCVVGEERERKLEGSEEVEKGRLVVGIHDFSPLKSVIMT